MNNILIEKNKEANQNYRSEIDGLRGIAVIAVIINHFNKDLLPSGFLGVDIFFVISGYVITSSLVNKKSENLKNFLKTFYNARLKRLIPTLVFFVIISSLLICLFNPEPRTSLRTGITSLIGFSNLYLFKQSTDYFASSTDLNIFTHTWSLGVEQQFYFLFPFLFWASGINQGKRLSKKKLLFINLLFAIPSVISFLFFYQIDQPFAYFLLPTRFWEIASGSIVFLIQKNKNSKNNKNILIPEFLLILIILILFLPTSIASFSTISIVFLTAFLIKFLNKENYIYQYLTNRKLVYIGLISYSLYLWHWSILCISRWTIGIYWWTIPFQLLIIFFIAKFSYEFIEKKFRIEGFSTIKLSNYIFAFISVIFSSSVILFLEKTFHSKLFLGRVKNYTNTFKSENCISKGEDLFFIGDSFAQIFNKISPHEICKKNINIQTISESGTPFPLINFTHRSRSLNTNFKRNKNLESKLNENIFPIAKNGKVIITLRSSFYFDNVIGYQNKLQKQLQNYKVEKGNLIKISKSEQLGIWLEKLENLIKKNQKSSFVLLTPYPDFHNLYDAKVCSEEWFRPILNKNCNAYVIRKEQIVRHQDYLFGIQEIVKNNKNAFIFDSFSLMCPSNQKNCYSYDLESKVRLYDDDHHPNGIAANLIIDKLMEI